MPIPMATHSDGPRWGYEKMHLPPAAFLPMKYRPTAMPSLAYNAVKTKVKLCNNRKSGRPILFKKLYCTMFSKLLQPFFES